MASIPVTKKFTITPREQSHDGQRLVIYGDSGSGKSTLASLSPNPVSINFDSGARIHAHQLKGIDTFADLRLVLEDPTLFSDFDSVLIDDLTVAERLLAADVLRTYKTPTGKTVDDLSEIGWGQAYDLMLARYRLLFQSLDRLVALGKNVVILAQKAQGAVSNASGIDFTRDQPSLSHSKRVSSVNALVEWADHVVAVRFEGSVVLPGAPRPQGQAPALGKATAVGEYTRILHTQGAPHFVAKSRLLPSGSRLPDTISFAEPDDASLWSFLEGK